MDVSRDEVNVLQVGLAKAEERIEARIRKEGKLEQELLALHRRFDTYEDALRQYEKRLARGVTRKDVEEILQTEIAKGFAAVFWRGFLAVIGVAGVAVFSWLTEWWKH